jgi:glycosyltransferase involved in cell wall biosynthesis
MNQNDHSLLKNMNIQSEAIIANQCNKNEVQEFVFNNYKIQYLSFSERGVGLNRNNALMRAKSDICLLADDDLVLSNDYVEIIKRSFEDNPNSDVIIFNLIESNSERYAIRRKFNVGYLNYMRFGAARIAFRRESITKNGITFNLHFGGGAEYSAGEDTLFLNNCLKKGLKIIAIPESIATLKNSRESTWFIGYNDKFFVDRGALFAAISRRWAWLLCLQFSLRRRKLYQKDKNWIEAFKLMLQGVKEFNS